MGVFAAGTGVFATTTLVGAVVGTEEGVVEA